MATDESTGSAPEPLFTVDLGINGGVFAPLNDSELLEWIAREISFWNWIDSVPPDNFSRTHVHRIHEELRATEKGIQKLLMLRRIPSVYEVSDQIASIRGFIESTFVTKCWPHSSTPIAKRAVALGIEDPRTAAAYLYVMLNPPPKAPLEGSDLGSLRGFLIGLTEKFGFNLVGDGGLAANKEAFGELRTAVEKFLREGKSEYEALLKKHVDAAERYEEDRRRQQDQFDEKVTDWESTYADLTQKHASEMDAMRKAFREGMALRGPVEYWTSKASVHSKKAGSLLWAVFGTLLAVTAAVAGAAAWTLLGLAPNTAPDTAKVAILALVGVMGIWGLRLVVRMWLSHTHLATDASERVTMVQTYLAILEADKMPSDEDRKLVLAPLFRPAADGLVKDEGLPHPMLDFLTRSKS